MLVPPLYTCLMQTTKQHRQLAGNPYVMMMLMIAYSITRADVFHDSRFHFPGAAGAAVAYRRGFACVCMWNANGR